MGEADETPDLPSFSEHTRLIICGSIAAHRGSNPSSLLMGRNSPGSCQFDHSPVADYLNDSTESSHLRGFHPDYQYLDDYDDKRAAARILRARVRSCVPCINHRILGKLGFKADTALNHVVVLKDRRQSYLQSCFP